MYWFHRLGTERAAMEEDNFLACLELFAKEIPPSDAVFLVVIVQMMGGQLV